MTNIKPLITNLIQIAQGFECARNELINSRPLKEMCNANIRLLNMTINDLYTAYDELKELRHKMNLVEQLEKYNDKTYFKKIKGD